MKVFVKVMKALSDPNRIKILKLLQRKSLCVCELQGLLGISQPTVSKHLKVLEEVGLVYFTKNGLWVDYYLADGKQSPYAASLLGNLKHWLEDSSEIRGLTDKIPFVRREDICKR
ncbi:MAG: transcriptional regulator [Desulfobacteraceae bacterium IS3]|jgi:ArsR family transcriptional regulator|nr:MAG: transcriptional regulator [Desulfobacteraceae bacterium IS3]HAO20697.1 transcriptional regulator [Desulfobacteraceae bacterium]